MFNNEIFSSFRIKTNELLTQSVDFVLNKFKQSKLILTTSSAYGQILFVMNNLSNLIFYYIEDSITELNIRQASRLSSIRNIASIGQYQPTRAVSAVGQVKLTVKPEHTMNIPSNIVIIPNYTKLICDNNGLKYMLNMSQDSLIFDTSKNQTVSLNILQGSIETQAFTGKGRPLASYGVQVPKMRYVDNEHIKVFVNDERWPRYKSLLHIPRNESGFMERTGVTSGIDIFFGNGNMGMIPPSGSEIRVQYVLTDGWSGVLKKVTNQEVSMTFDETGLNVLGEDLDLNELFNVDITLYPDFGYNPEPANITKLMLSKNDGNLVVEDDYELMFRRLQQYSTIRVFTDTDDPRIFNVFLIPDINLRITSGETYFNIPETRFILTDDEKSELLKFIHTKGTMIVGNDVELLSAIIRRYVINVALTIFDNVPENIIKDNVNEAIVSYFLNITRRKRIPKSDLIAVIEAIEGVDSVSLTIVSEQNEIHKKKGLSGYSGLDEFNDIIITDKELPIIRGGWTDRNSNKYVTGLSDEELGAVNIKIKEITPYKQKDYR